jgi:hypothetical protein
MKKSLLTLSLAVACTAATAKPYPAHDMGQVLSSNHIDISAADKIYDDLGEHAGMYPPQFDNADDKAQATTEIRALIALFNGMLAEKIITPEHEHYRGILFRLARLNWIAHNLDVPDAATAADKYFQQLLPLLSGKGKANIQYEYGSFLASSAQIERAIPVLQESVAGGNKEAHKALAMALLAQDKKADAIREMKTYIQLFPKDSEAQHLLQAIETGNIRREDVSAK